MKEESFRKEILSEMQTLKRIEKDLQLKKTKDNKSLRNLLDTVATEINLHDPFMTTIPFSNDFEERQSLPVIV